MNRRVTCHVSHFAVGKHGSVAAAPSVQVRMSQVTCVYLFHELPAESRRKAAAEMARVLKPGGILVLTDSVQYGDRPIWDNMLGMFSKFNEPYYMSYISEDLVRTPFVSCSSSTGRQLTVE